eukprot:jgi/Ulvmu1/1176/UM108_0002.1
MQVVPQLPQHLLLETLADVPLPHILLHLPPHTHPLALRAHHPSTDTTRALTISHLPVEAMHALVSAAAKLTHLRTLSLAGLTIPEYDDHGSLTPLTSLQALTGINVSNTGLGGRACPLNALNHALPAMPLLATLDLSDSVLDDCAMETCLNLFHICSSVESLSLLRAFPASESGFYGLELLADCTIDMPGLTALSVGGRGNTESLCWDFTEECTRAPLKFVRSMTRLAGLRELTMAVHACVSPDNALAMAGALAAKTQLVGLRYTVPSPDDWDPDEGTNDDQAVRRVWGALARAVGLRMRLTALKLCFDEGDLDHVRAPWMAAVSHLTRLCCLSLRESFEVIATAACALRGLRQLHIPIFTVQHSDAGCRALLAATHLEQLAGDMHVVTGEDEQSFDVTPWLPLLPAPRACCAMWMRPLVSVVAAHSTLRSLHVRAS